MTSSQHPLPGRTRVVETRVAGRPFERTLYVDATEPRACAALWASGDYTQLGVSEHENPGLKDLSWLAHFEAVSKVHLMLDRVVDSSPLLAHRHHLRGFFCNDDLNGLRDIRPFLVLESLGQAWTSALQHAEHHPSVQRLSWVGFSPEQADLSSLRAFPSLQTLNLFKPAITSLAGISACSQLHTLSITQAKDLREVAQLGACAALRALSLDGCRGVGDLSPLLGQLQRLETLVLNRLPLLSSLTFLGALPSLQSLNLMGTDVEDGCLQPVAEHPTLTHFVCTPRKHFTHTEAQLRRLLQARGEAAQ